jgi:hypothetical protein
MGFAIDTISGQVTAPGATFTNWTLASGDSLQVRNADFSKPVYLLNMWAKNQVAGELRLRSPKLHDNVHGIHESVLVADVEPFLADAVLQKLIPQDQLIAEQSGSGVAGDLEQGSLLLYYTDLPGVAARLISLADVQKRQVNLVTVELALTPGATGGYSGQLAIDAQEDLLQANTDYALLGMVVNARCTTVSLRGADTGNLRVSCPGEPSKRDTNRNWFVYLSEQTGLALIPVFNSANKGNTFVDVVQDENAGAVTVDLVLAQLAAA